MLSRLPTADLSTVLVETFLPNSFEHRLARPTTDAELAHFLSLAHSSHADFCIVYEGSLPLLYQYV